MDNTVDQETIGTNDVGTLDIGAIGENSSLDVMGLTDTPALPPPDRPKDAHRVRIGTVSKFVAPNTGSTGINIGLVSLDTGAEIRHTLWPPKPYIANINVDPNTLSEGEQIIGEDGRQHEKGNQRKQYARTIHNSKNSAEVDRLLAFAKEQGKDFSAVTRPASFDDLAANLNTLLSGVELIVTRVPQNDNPEYLNVNAMYSIDLQGDPKFLGRLEKGGYQIRFAQ